jgi:hypothetical protein
LKKVEIKNEVICLTLEAQSKPVPSAARTTRTFRESLHFTAEMHNNSGDTSCYKAVLEHEDTA